MNTGVVILGVALLAVILVVVLVLTLTPRATLVRYYPAYDYVFPRWAHEGPYPPGPVPPGPIIPGPVHPPDPNPLPYPPFSKQQGSFHPDNFNPHTFVPSQRIEPGSGSVKAGSESLIPGSVTELFAPA